MEYKLIFFIAFGIAPVIYGDTATNVGTFLDDIAQPPADKTKYDAAVRPKLIQDDPLQVTINLGITAIKEYYEEAAVLELMGFIEMEWTDELITTPLTAAGITAINITLSQDDVYMPIIIMTNSVEDLVRVGHTSTPVVLKPDGSIYYKTNFDFEVYCSVDATYYPFDTHSCVITFLPWQITSEMITLYPSVENATIDLTQYAINPSWNIMSTTSSYVLGLYSKVEYTIKIQRRGAFFTMYFIVPVLLTGVMSILAFMIPYDQARVRYIVTGTLVVTIVLNLVTDEIPKTTSPIPVVVYFLDWQFLTNIMLLSYISSTLHIYHRHGKSKVSGCLSCFVSLLWCFPCRGKTLGDWKPPSGYGILNKRFKLQAASAFVKEVKVKRRRDDDGEDDIEKEKKVPRIKWKTVGSTMDIFYLFLFLFINFCVYLMFMYPWINLAKENLISS
ncbi:CHRNG [Mytilus coruscus]|uniref:CHRNG n=1 Tax=Mytilus coruscus TaxID=42192 RepID=A0A6J8EBM9_MYTCO|nr:CHRNG [Mytilus coruscus]